MPSLKRSSLKNVPMVLVRLVKLDRKRRAKYGIEEIDPLNAFDLTLSEDGEEEAMEIDEILPPVAMVSAAMAHAELHGGDGRGKLWRRCNCSKQTQLKPVPTALSENTSQACQDRPSQRMRRLDFQQSELIGMTLR